MSKKRIKPLARPGFTMFNNYILDHIMPDLSPNGWKVLCVAIRKTIGWANGTTLSGRKEKDRIAYTQFLSGTGIGGRSTLSRAIQECLEKEYLLRSPSPNHDQAFDYELNMDYEIDAPEPTGTETGLVQAVTGITGPKTGLVGLETSPISGLETGPKTGLTKERERKGELNKEVQSSFTISPEGVKVEH